MWRLVGLCVVWGVGQSLAMAADVKLRQVISREHPAIQGTGQGLAVGRDGRVYVTGVNEQGGYVLRVSRDGREKFGAVTTYAITGVAAGKEGCFATANAHFAKAVSLYDPTGQAVGKVEGFTGNDDVGWDGPGTLEIGSSGDYFALDQHARRIVRINPQAELVRSYPLPANAELSPHKLWTYGFRLHEPLEQCYFVVGPEIQCRGFDGTKRWSAPAQVVGDPWGGFSGGFDVDDQGRLYVCNGIEAKLKLFDGQGQPAGELELQTAGRVVDAAHRITHLRVFDNDIIIRQKSDTELFQVYDRQSGRFRQSVSIDHELLQVTYPSPIWTSGQRVPLTVRFDALGRVVKPQLQVWLRPLGSVRFTSCPLHADGVDIPISGTGLYHLRVNSSVDGAQSEYQVEGVVEIRPENAVGSISIWTPKNRRYYRRGEVIPVSLRCRTREAALLPESLEVQLVDQQGTVHARRQAAIPQTADGVATFEVAEKVTAQLPPGAYRLTASRQNWTIADQHLVVGTGKDVAAERPFYRVRHGDYTSAFPEATFFNAPEQVERHVTLTAKLGENLLVERLGHQGAAGLGELSAKVTDADLVSRLQQDPLAVAPEKAEFDSRVLQTIAGYGASGIDLRSILLYMDAGLPIGTLFDKRPPAEAARDVQTATRRLQDYPAFTGWSWAANWWIEKRGADLATSPTERAQYETALKAAQDTGRWDPVLEQVSDRWIQQAAQAEQQFRTAMNEVSSRKLISAMTGPYRQPGMLPGITFAAADEVDLHFQAEQIQWPMISAHNVDFYKRPGRPAWGHPELWNDDGTGGQILSDLLQMVMRGANGIGQSGSTKGFAPVEADPRSTGAGATSVHRQLNSWLAAYGPWLADLEPRDPVAIPVSTRMLRMELGWQGIGGFYFTRLFEAYNACLRAHRPASFVFTEDCRPESLAKYRAVLLVSQTVELDPPLKTALSAAKQQGVKIFRDQSCRPEVLQDFAPQPLDRPFTRLEKLPHLLNDDGAFWHYREIILEHAEALRQAWKTDVPTVATCDHPEVLLTERTLGEVRVLWAVNDAAVPLEPGQLWRVSLAAGSRLPVQTELTWPAAKGHEVLELFSGRTFNGNEPLPVDLRTAPARLFVMSAAVQSPTKVIEEIPAVGPRPAREPFGSRIREIVLSADQQTALVTAAGWDRNLLLVAADSGQVLRQDKVGHHFAYAPQATSRGFTVQGFDLHAAEGYHLYELTLPKSDDAALAQRRFALFGLPKRGTSWAVARQWQEPINQFALPHNGDWIATAGDLGLVVWSKTGQVLWSLDWWQKGRERRRLLPAGNKTLVAYDGSQGVGYDALSGQELWKHSLGETGVLTGAGASDDGKVVVLRSTANGGRLFVVRDGQAVNSLATPADDFDVSGDGTAVAVVRKNELRCYDTAAGLRWSAVADDVLRSPRFSPDSRNVFVGSEIGTSFVYSTNGKLLWEHDSGGLPVAAWRNDGGLLVGTWLGSLTSWNDQFQPVWQTQLVSDSAADPRQMFAVDETPTIRRSGWGNAAAEPAPLVPNLLTETQALIEARCEPTTHGDPRTWLHKVDLLRDGDPAPPSGPWLDWSDISYLDSGWRQKLVVQVDTFRSQIRLKGVTIVEDQAHPEAWTRDMRLQWWDAAAEAWRDGPFLLFDGASVLPQAGAVVHTHWFDQPLEAAKFRFVSSGGASWPVGNLRWGELVFHGEVLGPSHPDAVANRPVAVLFDEREETLKSLMSYGDYPFSFRYDDAASGGKSLALTKAGQTAPYWKPPFGHVLPHWDFEIVEQPTKSGQYRWAEFSWKAASPETKGVTLRLGPHHGGGVSFTAGVETKFESVQGVTQSAHPPTKWETVRVDLWKLHGKPLTVRSLSLGSVGGGALFDRLRLARSEQDLDE